MMNPRKQAGTALIVVMVTFLAVFAFSSASVMIAKVTLENSQYNVARLKSQYLANSGLEVAISELKRRSVLSDGDWGVLDAILDNDDFLKDQEFFSEGQLLGYYTVEVSLKSQSDVKRVYHVRSLGRVARGKDPLFAKTIVSADIHFQLERSPGFQFSYFMNHFGWMAANADWTFNGNMGAAGIFNWYHSPLAVNGTPQFKTFNENTGTLADPIFHTPKDGQVASKGMITGGTISGFQIENGEYITGDPYQEFAFQPSPSLPLLTDSYFQRTREQAYQQQNYIKVGSTFVSDGVYGDGQMPPGTANESWRTTLSESGYQGGLEVTSGNLYLEGTDDNPIEIKGNVVVEGNLFIKGKVTGQGAINVRGNIYVGGDIEYLNPPTSGANATDQQSIETWLAENQNKDALGLYAKGTIGAGSYSNYISSSAVRHWLNSSVNESTEKKNGFDGMPNTLDFGEQGSQADVWNVQYYTQEDADLGRIPAGKSVGDVVPGSGEDFDGDGKEDPRITQENFVPRGGEDREETASDYENLNLANWGNAPISSDENFSETNRATPVNTSTSQQHTLASQTTANIQKLEAVLFTNKAFSSWINSNRLIWNGALISRLEAAILNGKWVFTCDRRLLGGGGNLGFEVPYVWKRVRVNNYHMDREQMTGLLPLAVQ